MLRVQVTNVVCATCATCPAGTYRSAGCSGALDSVCSTCKPASACTPSQFVSANCTATSNLICSECNAVCGTGTAFANLCGLYTGQPVCYITVTLPKFGYIVAGTTSPFNSLKLATGKTSPQSFNVTIESSTLTFVTKSSSTPVSTLTLTIDSGASLSSEFAVVASNDNSGVLSFTVTLDGLNLIQSFQSAAVTVVVLSSTGTTANPATTVQAPSALSTKSFTCSSGTVLLGSDANWTSTTTGFYSCGVVSIESFSGGPQIPVSATGLLLNKSPANVAPVETAACSAYALMHADTAVSYALSNTIARAMFTYLNDQLPSWMRLPSVLANTAMDGVDIAYYSGSAVKIIPDCNYFRIKSQNLYLVALISSTIDFWFMGTKISIKLSDSPSERLCVAVDTCSAPFGATAMIQIPGSWLPENNNAVKALKQLGYEVLGGAFAYDLNRRIDLVPTYKFWDGISTFAYATNPGSLWARAKVKNTWPRISSLASAPPIKAIVTIDGEVYGSFPDVSKSIYALFREPFQVLFNGEINIELQFNFFGSAVSWSWVLTGSMIAAIDLSSTQTSQCLSSDKPTGVFFSGSAPLPSLGGILSCKKEPVVLSMYILLGTVSTKKPSQQFNKQVAYITTFLNRMTTINNSVGTASYSSIANSIANELAVADSGLEDVSTLVDVLSAVRPDYDYLISLLRTSTTSSLPTATVKSTLSELSSKVQSKATNAVPDSTVFWTIDAVGIGVSSQPQICIFDYVCVDVKSLYVNMGIASTLQRCNHTDAALFGSAPSNQPLVHMHAEVVGSLDLFGVLTITGKGVVDSVTAPVLYRVTRMQTVTTLLGVYYKVTAYASPSQIQWNYAANIFNLAYANVTATVFKDGKVVSMLDANKIHVQGEFIATQSGTDLSKMILDSALDYASKMAQAAVDRLDVAEYAFVIAQKAFDAAELALTSANSVADTAVETVADIENTVNNLSDAAIDLLDPTKALWVCQSVCQTWSVAVAPVLQN
jgi:hypothetical protein